MEERLQKILARAGVASRRKCEEYITTGRVTVDGKVVRELGAKADPGTSVVRCDGQRIKPEQKLYLLVNKPRGAVSTNAIENDRLRVVDLVPSTEQRLFTVGRLDADSEGLIILTNDGEFANRLAHPRYEVPKTYLVDVDGVLSHDQFAKLKSGVHIAEGVVRFDEVAAKPISRERSVVTVVLRHGMNREIRRAFARMELKVRRLRRTAIGRLTDDLPAGGYRRLAEHEIQMLREDAGLGAKPPQRSNSSSRKARS